jgi:hypothetical protein
VRKQSCADHIRTALKGLTSLTNLNAGRGDENFLMNGPVLVLLYSTHMERSPFVVISAERRNLLPIWYVYTNIQYMSDVAVA